MRRICVVAFVCLVAALSLAQVNYTPAPMPKMQFMDSNGVPLAGGFVCTYQAGTSTPQATYTDYTGGVQNAACVPLDSAGRAAIFLGNLSYKFILQNSAFAPEWTVDGVASIGAVLAAPPAIGSVTPGPISGTIILATTGFNSTGTTPYEVNGSRLNFTDLAGWPGVGIPNSSGSAWGTSYTVSGSGLILCAQTGCVMITPNIGAATGTSLALTGAASATTLAISGPSTTNGIANNDVGITQSGTLTPKTAASSTVGTTALPYASLTIGPSAAANTTFACSACTALRTVAGQDASGVMPLMPALGGQVTTLGTLIAAGTCQVQTALTVTGTTVTSAVLWSIPTALPATWQTGIHVVPVVAANTVTLNLCNPTAGSITPIAQAVNIRALL